MVTYWGGEPAGSEFDVFADSTLIATENISKKLPLTFYEEIYAIPETLKGQEVITVSFKAKPGKNAGKVYGIVLTSNPDQFKSHLFY